MKLIFQSNPIGKGFDFFARYGTSSMRDPNDSVAHRRTSKAIRRNPTASMKKSPWNIESRGHEIDFKYWTKHRRACCFLLRCLWFIHFSFIPRPTADLHGRPLGFGWFISARLLFFLLLVGWSVPLLFFTFHLFLFGSVYRRRPFRSPHALSLRPVVSFVSFFFSLFFDDRLSKNFLFFCSWNPLGLLYSFNDDIRKYEGNPTKRRVPFESSWANEIRVKVGPIKSKSIHPLCFF